MLQEVEDSVERQDCDEIIHKAAFDVLFSEYQEPTFVVLTLLIIELKEKL